MSPLSSQVTALSPSQVTPRVEHGGSGSPVVMSVLEPVLSSVVVGWAVVPSVVGAPVVGAGSAVVGSSGAGAVVEPTTSVALVLGDVIAGDESSLHASAPRIASPPLATFANTRPTRIARNCIAAEDLVVITQARESNARCGRGAK